MYWKKGKDSDYYLFRFAASDKTVPRLRYISFEERE